MFELETPIQSPAKRDLRSVLWFRKSKCERPAEIHRLLLFVVTLWIGKFVALVPWILRRKDWCSQRTKKG